MKISRAILKIKSKFVKFVKSKWDHISRIFNFPSIDLTDNYNISTQAQVVVTVISDCMCTTVAKSPTYFIFLLLF